MYPTLFHYWEMSDKWFIKQKKKGPLFYYLRWKVHSSNPAHWLLPFTWTRTHNARLKTVDKIYTKYSVVKWFVWNIFTRNVVHLAPQLPIFPPPPRKVIRISPLSLRNKFYIRPGLQFAFVIRYQGVSHKRLKSWFMGGLLLTHYNLQSG